MKIKLRFLAFFLTFAIPALGYAESLLSVKNIVQRPFSIKADRISTWKKDGIRVFAATKDVRILQGPFQITADAAVCWFHEEEAMQHTEATVEVYCEGSVTILEGENYEKYEQVFLRFETMTGIEVNPDVPPIESLESPYETKTIRRGEEIRAMKKDEYLSTEIPEKVSSSPASQKEKDEVVDIIADNIDSWMDGDRRIVVALGNVKIKRTDTTIDADSVILWFGQKASDGSKQSEQDLHEMYAEGNVTMRRKDDVQIADKVFEDVSEDKGILINSQIKTSVQKQKESKKSHASDKRPQAQRGKKAGLEGMPAYVHGEEIRRIGKGQYQIKNGTISTCGYGHPHYHFKGKKIRLLQSGDHNIVSSTHNSVYVDKYPVAYLPYLSLDLQKKERLLKDWQFGSSSRFGSFLKTDWDLFAVTGGRMKEWSDLTVNLDYLQKRGAGTGLDFAYQREDLYGFVDAYYINDQGDFDINRIPVESENRGTVLWRHRQDLPYDWRLDMEYSHLSDPGFLREFFEDQFKEEKDRETVFYARRIHDTSAETFQVNQQLNGFDTTVDSLREKRYAERLPEAAYRIIGEPILDNRLIYTSKSAITYFDDSIEQTEPKVESESVARIDSVNRVSMPFKPWFFNVNPFVEGRATGYSESFDTSGAVDEANGPATGRFIGSTGIDWSSTHWRSYSVYNDFLNINRLRHVFVPELRYIYSPLVTEDPEGLYQYDEIDALDSSQVVVFGVKNTLQTKRGAAGYEKTVDFMNFDVDYYMFPTDSGLYTDGVNGILVREDDFVNFDFRSRLTDVLTFASERNEFNTETFQFDVLTSGFEVYNFPDWQYFIGHRFIRDISSTIILAADYKISEKWSIAAAEKYDLKSLAKVEDDDGNIENRPKNLKTSLVLSRYFHDWVGSITLDLDPIRNDNSYRFDITPKGLQKPPRRFWF